MRSSKRVVLGVVATAIAVAALPAAADAAPQPRATYLFHDHAHPGDGWHVELTVSSDPGWLSKVVLHSERCDATVLTSHVRIRQGGRLDSSKPFTTGDGRRGTWSLRGVFLDQHHFDGAMHVTVGACDGGLRQFVAHAEAGGHQHPGGGHADHHHISGTPAGQYPDLERASARDRRQVRQLWKRSWRAARTRFTGERVARSLGYRSSTRRRPPLLFHLRHKGYASDRRFFDARRVESLVYWRPERGSAVLIALMYRLPLGMRPPLGGELLGWHSHGDGDNKMTHVWLTRELRTGLANCMPIEALERAHRGLHIDPRDAPASPESVPCPSP